LVQGSWDRRSPYKTTETRQLGQDSKNRKEGKDMQNKTARKDQKEKDFQIRKTRQYMTLFSLYPWFFDEMVYFCFANNETSAMADVLRNI
jgi:hypothetical protein